MLKLNIALALLLIVCAIAVVSARHQARKLFMELEQAQAEARTLDIEWGRLLLEQSTWAMLSRVEVVAQRQLHMIMPDVSRIYLLPPSQPLEP